MKISATLIISGDSLDPEEISKVLNITPHVSKRRGDVQTFMSKKSITAKFGLWEWRSKDTSETLTINDHIILIGNNFSHVHESFLNLPGVENAWIDVHFVSNGDTEKSSTMGFLINSEAIAILNKIGLPMEITVDSILPA